VDPVFQRRDGHHLRVSVEQLQPRAARGPDTEPTTRVARTLLQYMEQQVVSALYSSLATPGYRLAPPAWAATGGSSLRTGGGGGHRKKIFVGHVFKYAVLMIYNENICD